MGSLEKGIFSSPSDGFRPCIIVYKEIPFSSSFTLLQPYTTHLWTIFQEQPQTTTEENREIPRRAFLYWRHGPTRPRTPLCSVFYLTGSEISRLKMAKTATRWRKAICNFFFDVHIRILCRFEQVNKKISVIYTLNYTLLYL